MDGGQITIGDNVFIGPNCGFYTATHPLNFIIEMRRFEKAGPIHIGSNTWFWRSCSRATRGDGGEGM